MTEPTPPPVLRVELPGVVSWSRPRRARGGVRYPAAYTRDRDAWALVVAQAVAARRWRPPATARYRVEVAVYGGGKRDLDRVCTAVLDALQAGHAVRDDCLVDALAADRSPAGTGLHARTVVEVSTLDPRRPGSPGGAAPGATVRPRTAHGPAAVGPELHRARLAVTAARVDPEKECCA